MKKYSEIKKDAKKILKGNVWRLFVFWLTISLLSMLFTKIIDKICLALDLQITKNIEISDTTLKTYTVFGIIVSYLKEIKSVFFGFIGTYLYINFIRGRKKGLIDSVKYVTNNFRRLLPLFLIMGLFTPFFAFSVAISNKLRSLVEIAINPTAAMIISIIAMVVICVLIIIEFLTISFVIYAPVAIDNERSSALEVLKRSYNIMKGHRLSYFLFELSFIGYRLLLLLFELSFYGYTLLCIFIIPAIYFAPYISISNILFYEEVKKLN